MKIKRLILYFLLFLCNCALAQNKLKAKYAGNPIFPGWYADPEGAVFNNKFWIYPTFSAPYNQQVHFDAFSSNDLISWTKHSNILDTSSIQWAHRAMWAPAIIEKMENIISFLVQMTYKMEIKREVLESL